MTENPYAAWQKSIEEYHNRINPQPPVPQQPNPSTDNTKKEQK